jgi:hypothetical protein
VTHVLEALIPALPIEISMITTSDLSTRHVNRSSTSSRSIPSPTQARRSFAPLRPIADAASQARVRDLVLQAYAEYEETATESAS